MEVLALVPSESGGVMIEVANSTSFTLGFDFGDVIRFALEGDLIWIVYPLGIIVWDWREDTIGCVDPEVLEGKVSSNWNFPT